MKTPAVRCAAMVAMVLLSLACDRWTPTGPWSRKPLMRFPPVEGPFRSFVFDSVQTVSAFPPGPYGPGPVSDQTKNSRILLYDNGALLYTPPPLPPMLAQYRYLNDMLQVVFARPDVVEGQHWDSHVLMLRGDVLTVEFGEEFQQRFENAAYVQLP